MTKTRSTVLGAFVLVTLATLTYFTLVLNKVQLGKSATWQVFFDQAEGVREGTDVFTSGHKIGVVDSIRLVEDDEIAPGRRVELMLSLRADLTLWEDARVVIARQGLFGAYRVSIERGTPGGRVQSPPGPLPSSSEGGALSELGDMVRGASDDVIKTVKHLEELTRNVRDGKGTLGKLLVEEEIYEQVLEAVQNFRNFSEKINASQGLLGRLINDPSLGEDVDVIVRKVREIAEDIHDGRGTIGKLLQDEALVDSLVATAQRLHELVDHVNEGRGALGRLFKDEQLGRDLADALRDFALITQDLRQGRGTIGKLLKSEEAYDDFRSVVRDLRRSAENIEVITLQVREGRGSLGRLIMDDTVVTDLEVMLSGFREAGEVARENAPLASLVTFTTFLFNVLN